MDGKAVTEKAVTDKANLDILRSFAVGTVLIDHLVPTLHRYLGFDQPQILAFTTWIGHAGVLAFFVHTSLVLMYSLGRLHATVSNPAGRFYIRRFFRIYPLAVFSIGLVVLLHVPNTTWKAALPVTRTLVVSNLLLVQNVWGKESILGPLWSLPYEVQMYVVLPALYLLAIRKRGVIYLVGLTALFCAFGTVLAFRTGHLNMAAYIPCFLAGVLCYALRKRQTARIPAWLWTPFVVTSICTFCVWNEHRKEVSYWSGWIFSLMLGVTINLFRDSEWRPGNVVANRTALYSYGMYLMHLPVLYLIFGRLHVTNLAGGCVAFIVLTVLAAIATFYTIEAPFIELGRRLSTTGVKKPGLTTADVLPAP